jgi:hypothetical protein
MEALREARALRSRERDGKAWGRSFSVPSLPTQPVKVSGRNTHVEMGEGL